MSISSRSGITALVSGLLLCGPALGAPLASLDEGDFPPLDGLGPPAGSDEARFGSAMAFDGTLLAVGAPSIAGASPGRVFVWPDLTEDLGGPLVVEAFGVSAAESFGAAVDVHGEWLAVGAPLADPFGTDAGAVFLYRLRSGSWVPQTILSFEGGGTGDRFGVTLALEGDTLLVGAPAHDGKGRDSGVVVEFRFDGSGWRQKELLVAPDSTSRDYFGAAVAMSEGRALIGAPFDDDSGSSSGTASVFVRGADGWVFEAKLVPQGADAQDVFGCAVALDGDRALIGAPGNATASNQLEIGAAYLFRRDDTGWVQAERWTAEQGADADEFGAAVCLGEDLALVGAPGADGGLGAAHLFERDAEVWQPARTLVQGAAAGDRCGSSLGRCAERLAVGVPGADGAGLDAGEVALFGPRAEPDGVILTAEPPRVRLGERLHLELRGGPAHGGMLLVHVLPSGVLRILAFSRLDADGRWSTRTRTLRRGLRGEITLRAYVWSRRPFVLEQSEDLRVEIVVGPGPDSKRRDRSGGRRRLD